ncbi:hypothetical protein LCGC14_1112200 [marine sediment metagenome]|uniref:Uncharacterized protein n=1 Tax=marine sediment metagenome TaxID=412755 RepID=A0A0F9M6C4_9ZZZZ
MASYRLIFGIIVGTILSFFTAFFFNMMSIINNIELYAGDSLARTITLLTGANFNFDMISFFLGSPSIIGFFAPEILAWLFIGYISGSIAKGLKRGIITGIVVVVLVLLIWIVSSIFSGVDLMALFQAQLIETLGGIISGLAGAFLGGLIGGAISGPYEEF